jgi:hypothetical protein
MRSAVVFAGRIAWAAASGDCTRPENGRLIYEMRVT